MTKIFIGWSRGIPESPEALGVLKESCIVGGIELSGVGDVLRRIEDAGLDWLSHCPGVAPFLNMAVPLSEWLAPLYGDSRDELLYAMRASPARILGLHLPYSAEEVVKMVSALNIPVSGVYAPCTLRDAHALLERTVSNLAALGNVICEVDSFPHGKPKIVLETLDYSRATTKVDWSIQNLDARTRRDEIEEHIERYGINGALRYVTEDWFVKNVVNRCEIPCPLEVSLLFDVGDIWIAGDTKLHERSPDGDMEHYFMRMSSSAPVHQVHLSFPEGDEELGYRDARPPYDPNDAFHEEIMRLTRLVLDRHEVEVVTLEVHTGQDPVVHAREMINQAELVAERLDLSV